MIRRGGGSPQAGFTLVEVMVALAVLAVAMGAVIHTAGSYAKYATHLKEKTFATWVASNLAVERQAGGVGGIRSEQYGTQVMGGAQFHWRITPGRNVSEYLQQLDIEVDTAEKMEVPLVRLAVLTPR